MESLGKNEGQHIDRIIGEHLNQQQKEYRLSHDFNSQLMAHIKELSTVQESTPQFSSRPLALPLLVLGILVVLTFLYFYPEAVLDAKLGVDFNLDISLFQQNGVKYMLYSLSALMFFSVVDRFIQLKIHTTGK